MSGTRGAGRGGAGCGAALIEKVVPGADWRELPRHLRLLARLGGPQRLVVTLDPAEAEGLAALVEAHARADAAAVLRMREALALVCRAQEIAAQARAETARMLAAGALCILVLSGAALGVFG
jgi:hypothetical protein